MYLLEVEACHGLGNIILIVKFLLTIVQWVVPIILIVLGTIDLVKAVVAGKDDDIKKHQQTLIKRIIAAVIVFLIPMLVTVLMGWIGNGEWQTCWNSQSGGISGIFKTGSL